MKKVLTLIMAFVLVLSLSATAFAAAPADPEVPVKGLDANIDQHFTFNKIYEDGNGGTVAKEKMPVEVLTFTVVGNDVPNAPQLSVADVATAKNPREITVTVKPATTKEGGVVTLGKYNYTITEDKGNTAGVTYSQKPISVQVMIAKVGGKFVETVTFTDGEKGQKVTAITNIFKSNKPNDPNYGPLTVDKNVTGNMGDIEAWFNIGVVLTSEKEVKSPITVSGKTVASSEWVLKDGKYTYTTTLKLQSITDPIAITDVPFDVSYAVTESADHIRQEGDSKDYSNEPDKGYTVSYKNASGSIAKKDNTVVVTNNKGAEVDTGVVLDSLPYVIILGIAVLSLVLFTVKRRVQD